ncbi:methylmalonyl-CoA epimerase [Pseudothermotoga lettingae]|uniref:methylmalonyl-CoA epimerase n=1 Tax=Pseudothermotoga lettingae TaxID=177758 RepID=UPI000748BBFF|nr:methylmalonyl-CoA epimerase [Pseudothermotoga lettingae]KUK20185.1 MAG: Glyoxalase/bleomycin resistance protein/dioxygenase [Pseudothermotoga lettingae]
MITKKIDHVGIAVRDASKRLSVYRDFFNLQNIHVEEIAERGIRVYMIQVGESKIELLEPMNENSEISKFLDSKGEGIHHIAFNVLGIDQAAELAKSNGLQPLSDKPKAGAGGTKVLFLHPKTTGGVLIELVEGNH